MEKEREFFYYQWSEKDLEERFNSNLKTGLSHEKALLRLHKNGKNSIEELKENSPLKILLRQFYNFFIILLIIGSIISYFVDGMGQTVILVIVIIINVALGFFQEFKAEKALEELKFSYRAKCKVLRDDSVKQIHSEDLVAGDIVILDAGDVVPADMRLIDSESLSISESALTGESIPVNKDNSILAIDTPLADRTNMAYASTLVAAGRAKGMVVATGLRTEFGRIAGLIEKSDERTPLENQILFLGKKLTYFTLAITALIFIIGAYRDFEILPLLTFTIALLIAAVPESLPTIITTSLAIGVSRMAKKKAIVRKLAAIESLGTVNIIATDKTGTLTDNTISVDKIAVFNKGSIKLVPLDHVDSESKKLFFHGIVCSSLSYDKKSGIFIGDPLEIAIANTAKSLNVEIVSQAIKIEKNNFIPFDSKSKFMATKYSNGEGNIIVAKGALEKIIDFCSLSSSERKSIIKMYDQLTLNGYRTIAVAIKTHSKTNASTLSGMTFLGLFCLIDAPSKGIKEAIGKAKLAGIRPIIITGDHPATAVFVANQIGLEVTEGEMLTTKDLETFSEKELKAALLKTKIFARVTPEDKIKIVSTLRQQGFSVAVTGDGLNDAPALKESTVGIAMGIKGTDVAKEAADIVLSDDRYATIISAIEYGRAIYDNIRNAITFLLSSNFAELFLIALAFIFGLPVPFLTAQILWINLITDSLPALALAFESPSSKSLRQKPRPIDPKSINKTIRYSCYLSLNYLFFGMILFLWGLNHSVASARTILFVFAILLNLVYVLQIRTPYAIWQKPSSFLENKFLLVSIGISLMISGLLFIKPFSSLMEMTKISQTESIFIAIFLVIAFIIAEFIKIKQNQIEKNESQSLLAAASINATNKGCGRSGRE